MISGVACVGMACVVGGVCIGMACVVGGVGGILKPETVVACVAEP